jgi:lipase chaperone LimK
LADKERCLFYIKSSLLKEKIFKKGRGICMNKKEAYLEIDDYLDLFLLAGGLGDNNWQEEVLIQLQNVQNRKNVEPKLTINDLWEEYKMINAELLDLYNELRDHSPDKELYKKIEELKQERMSVSKKIHSEEIKSK